MFQDVQFTVYPKKMQGNPEKEERTNAEQVTAEEEDGHHSEAIVEVELVLGAAQRVQHPPNEHEWRAALPQQKHCACVHPPPMSVQVPIDLVARNFPLLQAAHHSQPFHCLLLGRTAGRLDSTSKESNISS